jgi:hypothetical protein
MDIVRRIERKSWIVKNLYCQRLKLVLCHFKMAGNGQVFAMAGYSVFRHAGTELIKFFLLLKITFVA